ncbi:amino acid/amide ABC transporter substrate-binding protein (HAAT family) [Novosphingobium kunmingense]|uniref:Amino acid/amide ABC transporter substrate-binding protein (HAAT family) n=1 Tax=Novosphingobium kunmingense TaxID=1211806 RepID=A0A2N0I2S0_9SPHN|nr:penicillin-binding protein activator [Novosphingobium kunmingense]PKB25440.1 amino acid/amide ABC transporter substrate-binding protein (HAAT family) [Novosphingobium kunmingense]
MIEGRITKRRVIVAATALLLAGCKMVPGGPGKTPAPPTDNLPGDQSRHRVALLVPLSGANAGIGQSIANATTMALLDTNARNIRITTYDTATGASAAARKAVGEGAKLILGPLQADEVAPVASVARAAKVPLITYSSDQGVATRDVFQMGTTPENSIDRTVRWARGRGALRFGLLAPNGDYGSRASAAFNTSVRASGGTVVATSTYDRANTSVISAAQRLRGRGAFDAIMIADGSRFAVLAAPNLKRGAATPRLLGTELWSGESAIAKTAALRGSWFSAVPDNRFRQFSDSYKARFGAAPYRMATMGYDSVLLTVRVARDWRPGTPFPVARLTERDGFLGLDGPFRFGLDGAIDRALEVREAKAGSVTVVSPAPAKFAD